jgi:hypothetical protein
MGGGLGGCAPVIHPPPAPTGFLAPPTTTYQGALSREGAAAAVPAAAGPQGSGQTVDVEYGPDRQAWVRVGPDCKLRASVVSPLYVDAAAAGFLPHGDGRLALHAGSACDAGPSGPFTVGFGVAFAEKSGLLQMAATGLDATGAVGALRFTGTLMNEREAGTAAPPGTTTVHLLAEIVTPCKLCRYNRRSIALPGEFPFAPRLERQIETPGGPAWSPVCAAPCTAQVDTSARLRIGGEGILASNPFALPGGRSRIAIKASGSGTAARRFGWGFLAVGTLYAGSGAIALGVAEATNGGARRTSAIIGGALTSSSLAFLIPGIAVLAHDGTTVTTDAGETLAR